MPGNLSKDWPLKSHRGFRGSLRIAGVASFVLVSLAPGALFGQVPYESGELKLALEKLQVLGSVLYIAAHPDDENTAFLATMVKQRHYRTGNLSITRGDGGQNLLGPEQGDELSLIRTQELLGARRIDGAEQFFTRAIDFGYSKSADETFQFWGKEEILSDVVWVMRKFRPDVIVSRFTPTRGGHGNHTASAILAYEGYRAAADPERFPEQLRWVRPWRAKRVVWNGFPRPGGDSSATSSVTVDLGAYSPLLGLSMGELAGKSRTMHKSQGFGAPERRGTSPNIFVHVDGDTARRDLFDGVETSWRRISGGERIEQVIGRALSLFDPEKPAGVLPLLLEARREMQRLEPDPWLDLKRGEIEGVIVACSGIWVDAVAGSPGAIPGSSVNVTVTALNRSSVPSEVRTVGLTYCPEDTTVTQLLKENVPFDVRLSVRIPLDAPFSQPYWLENPPLRGRYSVDDQQLIGTPENTPAMSARATLLIGGEVLVCQIPVRYRWVDPTQGERYRAFTIVPPVSVSLSNKVIISSNGGPKELGVIVSNTVPSLSGGLTLKLPPGWSSTPARALFEFDSTLTEKTIRFHLTSGKGASGGPITASAEIGRKTYENTISTVAYPHFSPQSYLKRSRADLIVLDVQTAGSRIGYIMGAGDEVPAALSQLGYSVESIGDEDLETGDLSRFDAIVSGVRAYNTRPKLRSANNRLLDYVRQGGRYIVQYNTAQRTGGLSFGPFPFRITQDRVSVEEAPVTFVSPNHPLLTKPCKITGKDFEGWVQERGLYFAGDWGVEYDAPLECHDPGEDPRKGGLLFGRFGKGYFIYTGFAFFRQLPVGVPGAYRLFVNLLSQDVDR